MQVILIIFMIVALGFAVFMFANSNKKDKNNENKENDSEIAKLAIEKGGMFNGNRNIKMKEVAIGGSINKTNNIKIGSISILFALAAAATLYFNPAGILDGSYPIPDGKYERSNELSVNSLGIGYNEFTVKGSTLTLETGFMGVDYTYKVVDRNQIKLTIQGSTISYSFEKKDSSHIIINGAEFVKKK